MADSAKERIIKRLEEEKMPGKKLIGEDLYVNQALDIAIDIVREELED